MDTPVQVAAVLLIPTTEELVEMNSAVKVVLTLIATLVASACSNRQTPFDGMIPAGATSVSYARQSDAGNGVTFNVSSTPNSYEYVDTLRAKLHASGYTPCNKSAISKWEPFPTDDRHKSPAAFWIVELYTAENYSSFFVVRAEASPTENGRNWIQSFSLAVQTIPKGRQNMASIKEFCD